MTLHPEHIHQIKSHSTLQSFQMMATSLHITPYLVGGAVRDLILYHTLPPDLDVAVLHPTQPAIAKTLAQEFASHMNGRYVELDDAFGIYHQYKFGNVPEYLVNMGIEENPDSITRGSQWKKVRTRSMKAKNKALLHYGFFKPFDVFYYLLTPFYYFISPKNAMKFRKTLNQI